MGLPAFAALDEPAETPGPGHRRARRGGGHAGRRGVRRQGVPAAIVIAAGFAEAGEEGAAQQHELARTADEDGVTLVGPNCMGVLCTSAQLNAVGFVTLRPRRAR